MADTTIKKVLQVAPSLSTIENDVQIISFDADATGGTFTLKMENEETGAIAYNAAVGDIQTALQALSNITSVTVTLSINATQAGDAEGFEIEFTSTDATTNFPDFVVDVSSLTGVTTATITRDGTWATVLADAALEYTDTEFGSWEEIIQRFYVAHVLTLDQIRTGSGVGSVTRERVDDLEIEYSDKFSDDESFYNSTVHGQQLWNYLKKYRKLRTV